MPGTSQASGGGGGEGGGVSLVPMKEFRVPIVEGQRATGRLIFTLVLRADDAAAMPGIEEAMPALRETITAEANEFARLYASPNQPVDASRLVATVTTALHERHIPASALLTQVMAENA